MGNAYLFGHTGSMNRGCEAIVRSTTDILKNAGIEQVNLMVHDPAYDKKLGLDTRVRLLAYQKHSVVSRAICYVSRKYLNASFPDVIRAGKDLKPIGSDDVVLNIGGDTYCYDYPHNLVALNKAIQKRHIKNIFWGCSVDEKVLNNPKLIEDINRYDLIVTREHLSYAIFEQILQDKSKLLFACDPAFHLRTVPTELPIHFADGNTVGINLSPIFFQNYADPQDLMRQNLRALVNYVLDHTDMPICFVPHVYDAEENMLDIKVLREIKKEWAENDRVSIVENNLSCEQLKYIISRCRFFIGARTHTMIAAYSSAVPALALSYSIKSRGIARDLYGDEELVIGRKNIADPGDLTKAFVRLTDREAALRAVYADTLADYKQTICDAAKAVCSIG